MYLDAYEAEKKRREHSRNTPAGTNNIQIVHQIHVD